MRATYAGDRYSHFARAPTRAEYDAFMEGFREWCVTFWPEYLERSSCPFPSSGE